MKLQNPWLFETPLQKWEQPTKNSVVEQLKRETISRFPRHQDAVKLLPAQEQQKIDRIARLIVQSFILGVQPIRTVRLVGHADRDPQMGSQFEAKISTSRASELQQGLIKSIDNPAIAAQIQWKPSGVGATQLIVLKPKTEEERSRNRRVDLWLYPGTVLELVNPNYVRWIQSCLNQSLGQHLAGTGVLGQETQNSIRAFQKQQRLGINGMLNPPTLAKFVNVCVGVPITCRLLAWQPLRANETKPDRSDRFASQTFCAVIATLCQIPPKTAALLAHQVCIFVPSGLKPDTNKVHVFFSPGGVAENHGLNAVLTHGLRAASDASDWILISVSGVHVDKGVPKPTDGWRTIDIPSIENCLTSIGRSPKIDALRLSAHSRGGFGLQQSLQRSLITGAIDRVTILDCGEFFSAPLVKSLKSRGADVIHYRINNQKAVAGAKVINIESECIRAIGYSRLIEDAMVTQPTLAIPTYIRSQQLTLPLRGLFTTSTTPSSSQVGIAQFCKTNAAAIKVIVQKELQRKRDPKTKDIVFEGLCSFVNNNDVMRSGTAFSPGIYAHHLFVAEIAHEMVR
jgi:outer membrane protein OmpA-like peptidoglycan-associated protein